MAGGVKPTAGFGRNRALVGKQTVSWSGEAHALHHSHAGEPSAASRVCDERPGTNRRAALDPAPASPTLPVSLDFAAAFIDASALSFSFFPSFLLSFFPSSAEFPLEYQLPILL